MIFRYLYAYTGCTLPFRRLWISSLTDAAIRKGLKELKDGHEYDDLYLAAKARSEADWLVGINGTQALTVAAGRGTYSVGRVQTTRRWVWSARGTGRTDALRRNRYTSFISL